MTKILFDNQIFSKQSYGGISRYFCSIITGITSKTDFEVFPEKFYSRNQHAIEYNLVMSSIFFNNLNYKGKKRIENFFIERQKAEIFKKLKQGDFEVFHPTYYDTDFLPHFPENKPFVLTIHDMIPELFLDSDHTILIEETLQKKILIPKADHIIAISEQTKKDILLFYPELDQNKISVIYHGHQSNRKSKDKALYNNYLLFVGNRDLYKNFAWMLDSLANLIKETGVKLVCAGGGSFNDIELEMINSLALEGHIHHQPILNDKTLTNLYAHAICFIFPSKYEGFGMPILEAFSNNCPVLLANASCFPEIAADAALYFNLDNPTTLVSQVHSVMTNNELRASLIARAKLRVRIFDWETSINQHSEVYLKAAAKHN